MLNKFVNLFLLGIIASCQASEDKSSKDKDTFSLSGDSFQNETSEEEYLDSSHDSEEEQDHKSITDFFQSGPYEIVESSSFHSVTGCDNMSYKVYSPQGISDPVTVILGHGFARGPDVMSGWAEHLSSWGVEVLLPTLCHYNIFSGVDHEMNGYNMKELASLHGSSRVIYAGHSAGGLAAIIAASQDPNALGVVGLDTTDTEDIPGIPDNIGQGYASSITCPSFYLMGEPSTCNSSNNGLDLFRMIENYNAVKITSSDHCDFENPTDAVCEAGCENPTVLFGDGEIRPVIIALGTAAIISISGLSEDATFIWTDSGLESWLNSGIVQQIGE